MKRIYTVVVIGISGTLLAAAQTALHAIAVPAANVMIVELQTGSLTSSSEEFIELYNNSSTNVDVSTWRLEYFTASATNFETPSRKIPLHGIIGSHHYFLAASTNYLVDKANETFAATLAKTGGHIRLVSQTNDTSPVVMQDLVGWGTAAHPETIAAAAPADGKSLVRKSSQNAYIDSDNNSSDFQVNDNPAPRSDPVLAPSSNDPTPANPDPDPIPTAPDPDQTTNPTTPPDTPPEVVPVIDDSLLPPQISELLPNPASPASDDTDEYIELYNPNNQSLSLAGYKLQSGNTYSYSYIFSSDSIPAQSYKAFMVTQTGDVLSNAGGKVRLVDPSGNVIDETSYGAANEGSAWAKINGSWQWTTTPTANGPNVFIATSGITKVAAKKPSAKVTTKTVKAVSPKKVSAKTTAKKSSKSSATSSKHDEPPVTGIHPGVLAVISLLAVGYALYEYRDDLANRIHQFRRHRENRRTVGEER